MIRKAVIPAAGLGTRFLPATKSQPKEMLPIVDRPTIQYVVEEASAAGVTDILMVIGRGKRAIEEHFDRNTDLETLLEAQGRGPEADALRRISDLADIHFVWQKEMRGLGDAVLCARKHVGDEPFLLLLGDTIVRSDPPISRRLIEVFERYGESVVALEQVPREKIGRYGVISGRQMDGDVFLIDGLVEKPRPEDAPSDLAIAGRYALTGDIFAHLENTPPGKGGEIQLTDALQRLLRERAIYGVKFSGTRHDIGNKLDFIKTNVTFGLEHPEIGPGLREFLAGL